MARKRVSRAKREKNAKVSEKIGLLRREGKTGQQAAGEAFGMLKEGRLGRHGVYHRVGRRKKRSSRR